MRPSIDRIDFESAVRAHHAEAYRAALGITRDDGLALDAVQETFRRVLEGRLDLSGARDLGLLLRCAAARQALMNLRSERARARREAETAMSRPEHYEDRRVDARENAECVERELLRLPDDLRHALVLRFREGLTFAQVGAVLSIAEPSAHERVQRGLEKLRERLSRLGFAAALPEIGELVGRAPTTEVPPALEAKLLALARHGSATLAATPAIIAGLLATAVLTVGWIVSQSRSNDANSLSAVPLTVSSEAVELADSSSGSRNPDFRREIEDSAQAARDERTSHEAVSLADGVLEGRVVDEFNLPVHDAEVRASTVEREGKFSVASRVTKSAIDGSFRLELPVLVASGQEYALVARTRSLVQDAGTVRIHPGRTAPFRLVQFFAEVLDRPGAWSLSVTVRDPRGRAVPGAIARIAWVVRNAHGATWSDVQSAGKSEPNGEVTLHGEGLGPKLLSVDAREFGFAPLYERIELSDAGLTSRTVTLVDGLAITGEIVDENGAPMSAERINRVFVSLYATALDRNQWFHAEIVEPGRFRIPALAAQPHLLRFQHDRWSPFTLRDVMPGGEPLKLALKLRGDPTDRGNHDVEIHGAVFDAISGEPLALDTLDVFVERIEDDSPALRDGDFGPLYMAPLIAQTMQIELGPDVPPAPPPHTFALSLPNSGRYLVCIHRSGFAPTFAGPFELAEREVIGPLEVRLERGVSVRGTVLDSADRPLAHAWVAALGSGRLSSIELARLDTLVRSNSGRGNVAAGVVRTDSQGRFELAHLPNDRALSLYALHADFEPLCEHLSMDDSTNARDLRVRMRTAR